MAHVTRAFASLFSDSGVADSWSKLDDSHKYAWLRRKYWGRNIEDEAKQWRRLHPTVENNPANEIGSKCYGLDLAMELKCSKLWVRQDYIRIYDYCVKRHQEGPSSAEERARSVVVTGQPGIGKTYWVTYAMRRRLGEKEPFLWYLNGDCFLFMVDGVFQQNVKQISAGDFKPFLWAFVDADSHPNGVHHRLAALDTNLFIIYTTSPKRKRWTTLTKYTSCAVIVMNPWLLEELRQAAEIYGLTNEQQTIAVNNFEKLGPTARICIDFAEDPSLLIDYENRYQAMATSLTYDNLRQFVLQGGALDLDAKSHTMFIIRRDELGDLEREHLEPISANAKIQLMMAISALQRLERVDLYHRFSFVTTAKALAGLVYESLGYTHLQEGITLTLKPTIKMSPNQQPTIFHSKNQRSNSMERDSPSETSVFFPPNPAIIYEDRLTSVKPGHLYVPKASNQASRDVFFKLGAFFYIFQFTVANDHDIKKRIEDSLPKIMDILPPKRNWRFVLVSPPGCEASVKATSAVKQSLEGVTLYSAHLEIEQQMSVVPPPNESWQVRGQNDQWMGVCRIG